LKLYLVISSGKDENMQARKMIVAVAAMLLTAGWAMAQVNMQMVTVGDPGNAPDVNLDSNGNPLGSVGYTYQMGEFDVTAGQYCQFLNAVAAQSDPYGLYNSLTAGGPGSFACGINQTGTPGHYSYNTSSGYAVNNANFPVNYVSWGDAARLCNWLTNGQPTGVEGAGTTETGSYTLNGATTNAALMAVTRNSNAQYVIPTENEWYKAAYYKGGSTNAGYWAYPTQSNTAPINILSSTGTNNANFYVTGGNGQSSYTDPINYLTAVGAFASSPGPYGTYDMGGDVYQWNETSIDGFYRGLRGGSFIFYDDSLQASNWNYDDPSYEGIDFGFRVSEVPEPVSMAFLALGGLALLRHRAGRASSPLRGEPPKGGG
jgi:formylglycine-generating enzyme required for sulfatase activity